MDNYRNGGATVPYVAHSPDEQLTREELEQILRERIARTLKMTLEEFLEARDAGALPDIPSVAILDVLAGERRCQKSA